MIIVLTQCYPPRVGGIENLIENLSIELSKKYEVLVLADQHKKSVDCEYDSKVIKNITVKRFGGIKFLRRQKKIFNLNTGDRWIKALISFMASFLILLGKLNLFVSFRLFQSCLANMDGVCELRSACLLLGEPMLEHRKSYQT